MQSELPMADAVPRGINKAKILSQVRNKFAGALSNDTKWNELISFMRGLDGWRPSYRSKWVNGHVSRWDVEWFYHLPFPFVGVEWIDIGLHEPASVRHEPIDHSALVLSKLAEIGFEFEARGGVARVWGYAPKSYEDFPPDASL
ncbi:hypothetical protein CRM91_13920 [Burkholderia ambifaria]|jgi:hypothetical protein|uniref:Uncharacterized protein n=1 Tax=Burkholderia ambifaria (strain ATCC BAA-244 / DSM 16087 / CCUG 44356 / LMG 19182 / AMMD) TaxID=339670 RepID=Q0B4F1_BURCM|nr:MULTISPECIES: DUF6678 family protein [Burkholderia]ABI90972.1 hypothetical protein Bamb_5425 [Burkholderia ambifaria AMMD]PEH68958.1 hypothetical protein CRM91_13920 [Burkholderia ambifaria]UEP23441.1 hypothetical protein LL999_24730 [Burkholderia ambifaria]UEP29917.1 hypothetical protein LMA01_26240 [Burkholderia sp. B21-007]UEP44771.1 hypothetical protein LMA02_18540 [Burkholderia sp. B21-005]